jgi:hypothetical protein
MRSSCGVGDYSTIISYPFKTLCATIDPPISLSIDFETLPVVPDCWHEEYLQGNQSLDRDTWYTYEGTYSGYFDESYYDEYQTRLVSPPISTNGLDQLQTTFFLRHHNWSPGINKDSLVVQYKIGTDGNWITIPPVLQTYQNPLLYLVYSQKSFVLPDAALNKDIVFIGYTFTTLTGNSNDIVIDSIAISSDPFCPKPEGIVFDVLEANEVLISWNLFSEIPDMEFEYQLRTNGTPDNGLPGDIFEQGLLNTGTDSKQFLELDYEEEFMFFLRSKCANGDVSVWAEPIYFQVPCGITPLPSEEIFTFNEMPGCWTQQGPGSADFLFDTDCYKPSLNSDYNGDGGYMAIYDNNYFISKRLVTKAFSTQGKESVGVDFQWYHSKGNNADYLKFQYSFDGLQWYSVGDSVFKQGDSDLGYWALKNFVLPKSAMNRDTVYFGFNIMSNK